MENMLKELWGRANSPYRFKLPTLKEILIPAAIAWAFLILKYNLVFIVPAFFLLFGVIYFCLLAQALNVEPMQTDSGYNGVEHDRGGQLSDDDDWSVSSYTPNINIDGTPMVGMMDINGNPYGITSSFDHD